jgi:TPP-dependent trihydroxycyclohexane-1,2-dione (THcHDO) dehydratase
MGRNANEQTCAPAASDFAKESGRDSTAPADASEIGRETTSWANDTHAALAATTKIPARVDMDIVILSTFGS